MQVHKVLLVVMLLAVMAAPVALAQIGTATINGTVTDASAGTIIGADVTITHGATNTTYNTQSNEAGYFRVPALPVGEYEVTAEMAGFKRGVRSGIQLRVADNARVDFELQVGDLVETVEVVGAAPLVESSNATMGKALENQRVTNLPLNGRSALALVVLTPNVRFSSTQPAGFADRGVLVSAFSVNGGPTGRNYIAIDGATNINNRGADNNVNPAVDSIQEFKVESGTMSAEYGYTLGGVVNMVTKSGTNEFHGTAYWHLRNDALDARNTFSAVKPPIRYNQYGGSVGGPVVKNKSFFFYNYEQYNLRLSYTAIGTTPTDEQWSGNLLNLAAPNGRPIPVFDPLSTRENPDGGGFLRTQFPGNVIPSSRLDPIALNYRQFYPKPNTPPRDAANTNNVRLNLGSRTDAKQMTGKGDHQFSDNNRFSVRYILWDHEQNRAHTGNGYFPDLIGRVRNDDYANHNGAISDTHFFGATKINNFRASVARQFFPFIPGSVGTNPASSLGYPSTVPDITFPRVNFSGTPRIQRFPSGFGTINGFLAFHTLQVQDGLTWIKGNHTLKFGVELRDNLYSLNGCFACSGSISFNTRLTGNPQQLAGTGSGFASFLTGAVAGASADDNVGVSYKSWSQAFYIQDDWKATSRLTLNLGLRYDYQQWPGERNNGVSNLNVDEVNPENGLLGKLEFAGIDFERTLHAPDRNDFGPRFGFAFDLFGTGKTVIRGGYGLYYSLQGTVRGNRFAALGYRGNVTAYLPPGGNSDVPAFYLREGFPFAPKKPLGNKIGPSAFQSSNHTTMEWETRNPYSQQFTFTLQQQVPGEMLFETGYVGNKGSKIDSGNYDYNQLDPQHFSLGRSLQDRVENPYAGIVSGAFGGARIQRRQLLRPLPYYNRIQVQRPHMGSSIYHGFLVNLEKRYASGLAFLASYTFGKLISGNIEGFGFSGSEQVNVLGLQNGKFDRRRERAIHSTDSAKRFVLSGLYELPFGPGKRYQTSSAVLSRLAEGWQVNSIVTLQDGLPLRIFGANNFAADRPNSTGQSAKIGNPTRDRWFDTQAFVNPPDFTFGNVGRLLPDVRGPGIATVDFSVIKNTRVTEGFTVQIRAEFFNLLNSTNFFVPNTRFSPGADGFNQSGSFARITRAKPARVSQVALRFIF